MKRFTPLFFVILGVMSCGLWQPYGAMYQVIEPTRTPSAAAVATGTKHPPSPTPQPCTVTAAEALNLRAGPGTSYQVIEWLKPGQVLTIAQRRDGWAEVTTPGGLTGWVNLIYCER